LYISYVKSTYSKDTSSWQWYYYNKIWYKFIFHNIFFFCNNSGIQFSITKIFLSQTSFSLYFHNQWTDFHKLSYAGKPQMRAICTYVGYTKAITNDWDIRPSVVIKALSANISWMAEWIHTIELALESAHQSISNNIWYISKW